MKRKLKQLIVLLLATGGLSAQTIAPGGIPAPELWFRTVPVNSNLAGNYRWQDFSGDSNRLNVYDSRGAAYGDEFTNSSVRFYNGNPALSLSKLLDTKSREILVKGSGLSQATIFGVFAPSSNFDKEMLLYGLNGRAGQGVFLTTDKIIPSIESGKQKFDYGDTEGMDLMYSSKSPEGNLNAFREKSIRIAAYYRSLPSASGIWGERTQAVLTLGTTYNASNVNYNSRFSMTGSENRAFSGYIPELIAYGRILTPLERRQVDSYLAIKYGLSLPVSLIGSKGQLLWDYAENPAFSYRITGIYRDDTSGLYQRESATSYEESPNYSDQNDYYYLGSPNYRSSASRLLVLGRQFSNELKDDSYLFWADNNSPAKLKSINGVLGMKMMDRKWLVKTNIGTSSPADRLLEWQVQDLDMATKGFVSTFKKASSGSSPSQGTAFTKKPLSDRNGYLGILSYTLYGDLYVKFGNNQSLVSQGSHDYGYYINSSKVYPIIRGAVSGSSVHTLILTSRLEIEKDGNIVYLRVDGHRINSSEITIDPQDTDKQFYGALSMTKGIFESQVELRHGGFVDTGNRIELSYSSSRASEFKENNKGRSFLLIDRTGTGNFDLNTVDMIEVDEIDASRQKVIFNNVYLQTGNMFTFAYRESDLAGEIETIDPSCNQANGEITVRLKQGSRAFKYTLTDVATGQVVKSGRENSYTIHLTGLKGGEYELKVSEAGGFNFENIDPVVKPTRAKTTNFFPVVEGNMEWTVSNTTDIYMIGWTTFVEDVNNSKNIIHYGLKKQGATLYKIVNGKQETTGVTVAVGDVLKIAKNMNKVTYYKNGTQFTSSSISWLDYLAKFYGLIDMSQGPAEILNVNAEGFFNLADYNWTKTTNMNIGHSDGASLVYSLALEDPCRGAYFIQPETQSPTESYANNMEVIMKPDLRSVTARVIMEEEDVVTFAAYNLNGALVKKVNLSSPSKIQETDLDFQTPGVYIIKAITTNNGEFSRKIIIK